MQEEQSSATEGETSKKGREKDVKPEVINPPTTTAKTTTTSTTDVDELDSVLDVSGKSLELALFDGGDGAGTPSADSVEGLCVYKNAFYLMPKSLGNFKGRLKTLKFFANEINLFPPEFRDLVELEQLQVKVSMPGLSGLPLEKLESLKELELSKVPPRPSAFPNLNQIAGLKRLTKLSVCHFSIRYLPPEIGCLNSLEFLDLSFNKMRSLPDEIISLNALVSLKVANNKLVELPSSLSALKQLKNLDLSRNRLASLGSVDLNLMQNLQKLNLQYNKLLSCEIPAWMHCNLEGNCADMFNDNVANSAVEMDVYETIVEEDQSRSCNGSTNPSSTLFLMGSSSSSASSRCSARRSVGKRWKRKQYLQQQIRQERLSHSRKWKVEEHEDVLSIQAAANCKTCKKPNLDPELTAKCSPDCKQSFFGDCKSVDFHENSEIDDIGSKDLKLENCCCVDLDGCPGVHDVNDADVSSASLPYGGGTDQVEGQSKEAFKPNPKSKRHSDRVLDNPKPRKTRRSTDEQSDIARKYSAVSFCGIDDRLVDGFYDAGRDRPFMSLISYDQILELDSREVILIDREVDEELDAITLSARALVYRLKQLNCSRHQGDEAADVILLVASLLALFVSDHFGGSDRSSLLERVRKDVSGSNYCKPFVCTCSTGTNEIIMESNKQTFDTLDIVFRDMCEKSIQSTKARLKSIIVPIGSLQFGVCRHRAVLMKYLCDRMDPPVPCELIRGYLDFSPHAWNAIPIKRDGSRVRMIVDACRPHDIREEMDPEYFCRYMPLTRITASIAAHIGYAPACSFPSLSASDEVERAASSSLIRCKVGNAEAVAKVRTLEVFGLSSNKAREFEYRCMGEVRMLGAVMGHACIVQMYGHQITSKWVPASDEKPEHRLVQSTILMQYVKGGSLKNYLKKLAKANERHVPILLALTISRDIACALKELHLKHIIHRDIKSENILLDMDGKTPDSPPIIKLCDFDQAVPLRCSLHACCISHMGVHPPNVCVGTPRWMAPEVLRAMQERNTYGLEVDIWSYGCLLFELLTLQEPYSGMPESNIYDFLQGGKRPQLPDELERLVSPEDHSVSCRRKKLETTDEEIEALRFLADIFHKCTVENPADRPTAETLFDLLQAKTSSFTSGE